MICKLFFICKRKKPFIIGEIFFIIIHLKDFTGEAFDFLKDIIIIVVIVVVIRTFFVMPFQINGQSMADTYYNREFIIVDRLSYRNLPFIWKLQEVERGDVVVFAPWVSKERKYFIKRVIGLPWETVKIADGKVSVQKKDATTFTLLDESLYLNDENLGHTTVRGENGEKIYKVPENRYFVMGDNRNHSTDSRTCFQSCSVRTPYISPDELIGKVFMDLGYFHFRSFSFFHPELQIKTTPKFFRSHAEVQY